MFEGILKSDELLLTLEKIENYGCHCIFGDNWKKGRSRPLNDVDQSCKDLTNCYKCINLDETYGMENDGSCDPEDQDFNFPDLDRAENEGILESCLAVNNNDICKARLCSCDTKFVLTIVEKFFEGLEIDNNSRHSGPGSQFFENYCPPTSSGFNVQKACCGDYPTRFPYRSDNGKACCLGKTYQ